jgi:biopolymer transport protein ExbB
MHDDKPYLDQAVEILGSGGWIMIPLFILGLMAFYVAARLWVYFLRGHFRKTSMEECEAWVKDSTNAKGQVGEIIRYSQDGVESLNDIQNRFAEIRTAEMPRLNQNITFLTIVVNTAPLMGLLGTVLGMLTTFYGISLGGSESTTNIVASGIHEALITTQMGLCLAIPGYFVIYYLRQKVIDYEGFLVRLESITLQQFRNRVAS